ncbi:MAG: PKD domain-containing protein [Bacteroidia bacterium]
MKGSMTTGVLPNGTLGVTAPSNTPGSRGTYAAWVDCNGEFWMYGGSDFVANAYGDLWKFDPVTLQWTWMAGSNTSNSWTTFGAQCQPSPSTDPGSRWENRAVWTDAQGRLWSFGGPKSFGGFDTGNELWCYDPATQDFTWITGSLGGNPPSIYGTLGIGAPGNTPGGRAAAASFKDLQGNFWLFGGYDLGAGETMGDLWKYIIDPQCPPGGGPGGTPTASFTAQPTTGCRPSPSPSPNTSTSSSGYDWDFGDGNQSTTASPSHTFTTPGSYDVMLIAHGSGCNSPNRHRLPQHRRQSQPFIHPRP